MTPFHILLVEDSPVDAKLLKIAFQNEPELCVSLVVAENGAKALAYLHGDPPYSGAPAPDLVILDWNLPQFSGLDVLDAIRGDRRLRDLRAVMFSASPCEETENQARKRGVSADGYFSKPFDYDEFMDVARAILGRFTTHHHHAR